MSLRTEAIDQGLTTEEFDRIVELLGREPNHVELGIFAAMWSEHCCYKTSRLHLKQLPTRGSRVVQGPGENAGIIEFVNDWVVAFKIESHNHPSFIEPKQGAATGVGGILRDIFTMGARPIALLDSLRFGEPKNERTPYLVHGVIDGVGSYGNCVGIPTVGGEVYFDASYNGNNLVNVMAVGIAKKDQIYRGVARGVGNMVLYLGSRTGKDGIHGATMASEEFGSGNEERRPTVQVGDPFTEKLVMEACLEMMHEKLLVGAQDMGAAGFACSTLEMSARGASGMQINLDLVPCREENMNPYEIFLSESQERMLLVAEPADIERIVEIAKKWEVECVEVGNVTDTGRLLALWKGEEVVNLPVRLLTEGGPAYDRPWELPAIATATLEVASLPTLDVKATVERLLDSENLSSREFVYRQYDYSVGTDTVVVPGSDAAVLRIKGEKEALAVTLDSNSNYCSSDAYHGTQHVLAEAVRNLACVGAKVVGVTNCLNFGNPEIPKVMGELRESIRGLADACKYFEIPVTGGNVSLYNQTGTQSIKPTPTIGVIGFVGDAQKTCRSDFREENAQVALLGKPCEPKIYQSEFARVILGQTQLACPPIDLHEEQGLARSLVQMIEEELLLSAHDCSDGGLMQTLIESATHIGCEISIPDEMPLLPVLFGEYSARAVISFKPQQQKRIEEIARNHVLPILMLGQTQGKSIRLTGHCELDLDAIHKKRARFFKEL